MFNRKPALQAEGVGYERNGHLGGKNERRY